VYLSDVLPTAWQAVEYADVPRAARWWCSASVRSGRWREPHWARVLPAGQPPRSWRSTSCTTPAANTSPAPPSNIISADWPRTARAARAGGVRPRRKHRSTGCTGACRTGVVRRRLDL